MDNFDLKKYLAEGKLLKEEVDVNKILSDGGYDEVDDEELLATVKSRLKGKSNIGAKALNLLIMKIEDEEGGNIDFSEGKLLKEDTVPSFRNGYDVIEYLDNIPEFKEYRNEDASYDDQYYLIPTDVFTQVTGWTEEDVETIDNNLEAYEGSITWNNTNPNQYQENTVSVIGGA
jgi:hypothetical protein